MIRTIRRMLLLALLGVLAACGNAVPTTQSAATAAPVAGQPAAQSPPTTAPTSASTAATISPPTKLPVATAVAPQPTAAGDALAEGLTSEGYHFLGRADAPATLVMYSDFL
jgi:hypothetical protein